MSYIVNSSIFETESDAAFEHVATYLQEADREVLLAGSQWILAEMAKDGWSLDATVAGELDDEGEPVTVELDHGAVLEQIQRYLDETCLHCGLPDDQCDC